MLLAGPLDPEGLKFLETTTWLPIFAAAAADDQYVEDVSALMQWILAISGNPRNTFSGFKDGKHGRRSRSASGTADADREAGNGYAHQEPRDDPTATVTPQSTPMREFWQKARPRRACLRR